MKERLIWCPNEISLEEWEAMSRDDQIAWWKKDIEPDGPRQKIHMVKAIELYQEGSITGMELVSWAMKYAAVDEIEAFVAACPPDILADLKEHLAHYGPDEPKWPRTFCMSSYFPWVTPEEIAESKRKEQEQIWAGVRLLKEYFDG